MCSLPRSGRVHPALDPLSCRVWPPLLVLAESPLNFSLIHTGLSAPGVGFGGGGMEQRCSSWSVSLSAQGSEKSWL